MSLFEGPISAKNEPWYPGVGVANDGIVTGNEDVGGKIIPDVNGGIVTGIEEGGNDIGRVIGVIGDGKIEVVVNDGGKDKVVVDGNGGGVIDGDADISTGWLIVDVGILTTDVVAGVLISDVDAGWLTKDDVVGVLIKDIDVGGILRDARNDGKGGGGLVGKGGAKPMLPNISLRREQKSKIFSFDFLSIPYSLASEISNPKPISPIWSKSIHDFWSNKPGFIAAIWCYIFYIAFYYFIFVVL